MHMLLICAGAFAAHGAQVSTKQTTAASTAGDSVAQDSCIETALSQVRSQIGKSLHIAHS